MRTRDVVTGLVVLIVLVAGVLLIKNARDKRLNARPSPTPTISERISNTFPSLNIPEGTERAVLADVSGGDALGIATRTEIVANLPDLAKGQVYQGYLENAQGKTVLLGTLRLTKSGWLIEYNSAKFPGYNKVIVATGAKNILEGSF